MKGAADVHAGLGGMMTLRGGVEMPKLGLGTYKSSEDGEVERAIEAAFEAGYRRIDTASVYGNERGVGRAVVASGLDRDEVFITTKVWNDEQGYDSVLAAAHRSLERLGMDRVDLYLVHWPIPRLMESTWVAMEELLAGGRTRAIGVCNFLKHHLEQLDGIAASPSAVNQFEFHPQLQQPALVRACEERGIIVEAWAPLMRGWVFEIPELVDVGRAHEKSAAQVALRWALQRGAAVIPKSVHPQRIRENGALFDFELSQREMALIDALDADERVEPDPEGYAY